MIRFGPFDHLRIISPFLNSVTLTAFEKSFSFFLFSFFFFLAQYAMLPVSLVMKMCSSVKRKAAPLS